MNMLLWAAISLLAFLPATARAQTDHKQVLALYSTRRDAEFSIVGENELTIRRLSESGRALESLPFSLPIRAEHCLAADHRAHHASPGLLDP